MRHNWTWEEINTDWLVGSRLALPPEEIVAAFNKSEEVLGHEWIEAAGVQSGCRVHGTSPTLCVVTTGQQLASLDGASGIEELIKKLRANDASSFAELTAVHLVRSQNLNSDVELGPIVQVADRMPKPDFRIRRGDEPWTYVEVTQPDIAEAETKALAVLNRVADLVHPIQRSFSLEVLLRREPTDAEIDRLASFIPDYCLSGGNQSYDMPELAILSLNVSAPTIITLVDHPGEPNIPRLGFAKVVSGPGEPNSRHISVRMAYADDRAEAFLRREAKQLPIDSPGLIMVQVSRARGGIRSWEPILKRRFQPDIHTRVSAVCLFRSGHEPTPAGEAWIPKMTLIQNPHARRQLPPWIADTLSKKA
jgi:hypothetical protein